VRGIRGICGAEVQDLKVRVHGEVEVSVTLKVQMCGESASLSSCGRFSERRQVRDKVPAVEASKAV
jgi:hypothetical protein